MRPLASSINLTAAAINRYSGVTPGLVMYLCLWKTLAKILVHSCLSSILSTTGNAQNPCQWRILCCDAPQIRPYYLDCRAPESPFQLLQMVPRCNCAVHIYGRMLRLWGSHLNLWVAIIAAPLEVLLGNIGG